jgi:hypothetical protein
VSRGLSARRFWIALGLLKPTKYMESASSFCSVTFQPFRLWLLLPAKPLYLGPALPALPVLLQLRQSGLPSGGQWRGSNHLKVPGPAGKGAGSDLGPTCPICILPSIMLLPQCCCANMCRLCFLRPHPHLRVPLHFWPACPAACADLAALLHFCRAAFACRGLVR